jgi:adenylate kinase family enzyme
VIRRRPGILPAGPAGKAFPSGWPAAHTERVQRVSVVGNSGSGKTTFARELSRATRAPHLELDSVFHQPGWVPLPRTEFRARVAEFAAADRWVVDGNYNSSVQDLVWARADTVIWIDPPRRTVMRRVIWRTLRRMLTRAELWNGNTEPLANLWRLDPAKSVIAWSWTSHRRYQDRYAGAAADPANAHLHFIRLRTPAEMARLTDTWPDREQAEPQVS